MAEEKTVSVKINGFDKDQTETYKKNLSKVTKDMSFVDEDGNTYK